MATRISQPSTAGLSPSPRSGQPSFIAKGTFTPKEVWGVFSPIRVLTFDGEQFAADLRTGESLQGRFQFTEAAAKDTLTLSGQGKQLVFTVDDTTLGPHNELTSLKLSDSSSKAPAFSLFLKRA